MISALNYTLIGDGYKLINKGAYLFHLVEQKYTNQYIDKTWKIARKTLNPPGDGPLAGFLLHFCHILRNYNVSNVEI